MHEVTTAAQPRVNAVGASWRGTAGPWNGRTIAVSTGAAGRGPIAMALLPFGAGHLIHMCTHGPGRADSHAVVWREPKGDQ
jgi:hypothetical protein